MNNLAPMKNYPGGGGCKLTLIGCGGNMLHIKLKGMKHRAYSVLSHTLNPQMTSKGKNIFLKVVMLHIIYLASGSS